jgi:predicted small lipoprotein YifL
LPFTSNLRPARMAVIGALVAMLGLTGCGRKGGLDPPPAGATIAQEPTVVDGPPPDIGADGRPVAPPGPKRSTPIDWLLD